MYIVLLLLLLYGLLAVIHLLSVHSIKGIKLYGSFSQVQVYKKLQLYCLLLQDYSDYTDFTQLLIWLHLIVTAVMETLNIFQYAAMK